MPNPETATKIAPEISGFPELAKDGYWDGRPSRGTPSEAKAARASAYVDDELQRELVAVRRANAYALFPEVEVDAVGGHATVEGVRQINFAQNDYLGLSTHRDVVGAMKAAIDRYGSSRCSSPLAGGYTPLHRELELLLARTLEQEAVVLFASGYQANVGLLSALADPDTTVVSDLFNHASIIDGIRLGGAELRPFKHNSVDHLAQILKSRPSRRLLVVVEGVYSADGDRAPIQEIVATSHKYGALCIVDEAHSLGVLGPHGRGAVADADALADVDILTGTLSKSLASVGGFIATTSAMADLIRHRARPLIFSASLPAAQAAAASEALKISLEGLHLRTRLWSNKGLVAQRFRAAGLDTLTSTTPIIPVLVGDKFRTFQAASELRRRGVLVCPAVPPMVQNHLSRLRLHVTAAHSSDDVLAATAEIIDVLG